MVEFILADLFMFVRLVYESFRRQTRRKLLMATAVTLGAAVSTAMIAIAIDIGDKISHELRSYGANLVVTPGCCSWMCRSATSILKPAGGATLNEADLPKIKGIFWRNNITGFTPELPVNVKVGGADATLVGTYFAKTLTFGKQEFTTGAQKTFPWWKVNGAWPADDSIRCWWEKVASRLGIRSGGKIPVNGIHYLVVGIVSTGGIEDEQIIAPLSLAQRIAGKPDAVGKILSAR